MIDAEGEVISSDGTPEAYCCGYEVGLGSDAFILIRGTWFHSREYDTPVFLLDPDTKLRILQMPNGQLAFQSDDEGHPTLHAHKDCLEHVINEEIDESPEDDTEDY